MARLTLRDLLDRLEPEARRAFLRAVLDLKGDASLAAFEAAFRRGDVDAMLAALRLDQAEGYFAPLDRALRDAFEQGGNFAFVEVAALLRGQGGARASGRLDATNPRSQRLLQTVSSSRIVEIAEETRATVREILGEAMTSDASPRVVALNIVGRIDRTTGRRSGGIIGLTSMEARWVANARAELASGDPAVMARFLERKARDKRFDPTVRRAIREGRPVAPADVTRIIARYSDTLLRGRGERIGRTEVLGTLHLGRDEGLQQMEDRGTLRPGAIRLEWDAAEDAATRLSHRALDRQKRRRGEPFVSPVTGAQMLFPGDRSLGAPASEHINCRCVLKTSLNVVSGLRDRLSAGDLAAVRAAMAEG